MPTVNHDIPWMYYPKDHTLKNNDTDNDYNNRNNKLKELKDFEGNANDTVEETDLQSFANVFKDIGKENLLEENIADGDKNVHNERFHFDKVTAGTKHLETKNHEYKNVVSKKSTNDEANENNERKKNKIVLNTETTKLKVQQLNRNTDNDNIVKEKKESQTKKAKWRLNSGVLVTLVILNITGQGIAVEVVSSSSLASLLGYPSTCTLGSEVRPCTLSLTCWLGGGTRVRGCGGWLFACCQPPEDAWNSLDNNIPSSDWQYKVSPPRLRQVPQRSVMPNNVFRRRVDDDITQVDCGLPSNRVLQKRIIGGREARFAEFPWQAHVRISEFQCGGVLVSQWYVATAAHCVSRAHIRDIVVWLGALDTSSGSHTARKVGVYKKILHPLFQFRMTQPDRYDIALLKLSRPVSFTRHIRAICLPDSAMLLPGRSAVIAGWGKTDATDTHTGTNMLRSATVPILSKDQCINWHQSKQISVEIHSEMICAGHSDGHQDACLGDSGGPLIVPENGRYYLVGITSAGFGCGVDHQPGIYHNVLITASWIRRVLSQEDAFNPDVSNHYYRNTL